MPLPNDNPYRAPEAEIQVPQATGHDEQIRQAHIAHETSVKGIGFLMILVGGAMAFGVATFWANSGVGMRQGGSLFIPVGFITGGMCLLLLFVGFGIRCLNRIARVIAGILCVFGLLMFPIGTLINGYFLYLLFSQKSRMIFSPEYQEVIAATPHVKYRTPMAAKIVLVVLILALAILFFILC